jgi:competence protein ComEA
LIPRPPFSADPYPASQLADQRRSPPAPSAVEANPMTETGFDWRRLSSPTPEVHADPQRSAPIVPLGRWLAIAALLAAGVLTSVLLAISAPQPEVIVEAGAGSPAVTTGVSDDPATQKGTDLLTVDVDGAVIRPGLVTLPTGSRIGDAIAAAGGFAPTADARAAAAINLAAAISDGDQVTVPDRTSSAASGAATPAAGEAGNGQPRSIDLDHATAAELDTLPGVGPVTADKILAARDEAPFQRVDDLLSRKLVGPSTFEKLKDLVTADGR